MSPMPSFDQPTLNRVPSIVVVDPRFDAYVPLAASARHGAIELHMRSSGADALRLGKRLDVDAWIVAEDLDDMSGHDLVELLKGGSSASVAMVVDSKPGHRALVAATAADEAGADTTLSHPISFADLERLLSLTDAPVASTGERTMVTLPIGVGGVVVAVAVLAFGISASALASLGVLS